MQHHGGSLRQLTRDDVLVTALTQDPHTAALDARSRAIVTYALKLTQSPDAMTEADVDALRTAGLTDRDIHDIAAITAYFNFVNRFVAALGVQLEET